MVNTYLDKVARGVNIMPRSIMLKGPRGRRVSELSCAFLFLFNFASFDNCGDSQAPVANFLCLVSGYELVTASLTSSDCRTGFSVGYPNAKTQLRAKLLRVWDDRPFMTEKQTLFPMACVCGAALRTSGPP